MMIFPAIFVAENLSRE